MPNVNVLPSVEAIEVVILKTCVGDDSNRPHDVSVPISHLLRLSLPTVNFAAMVGYPHNQSDIRFTTFERVG